jgi:hypothetical protein
MLSYDGIARLLALQSKAYELQMWLDGQSVDNPELLSAETAACLSHPSTATTWLSSIAKNCRLSLPTSTHAVHSLVCCRHSRDLVSRRAPAVQQSPQAVSDHPGHDRRRSGTGLKRSQALALKHLAASQQLPLIERGEGNDLVNNRRDLRDALLLWTRCGGAPTAGRRVSYRQTVPEGQYWYSVQFSVTLHTSSATCL